MKVYIYYREDQHKKNDELMSQIKDDPALKYIVTFRDVANFEKSTDFHYFWNGQLSNQLPQLVLIPRNPTEITGIVRLLLETGAI